MLEGVLASVLNRFLAPYVDGLNTNQLNVGIWSGDVKLRNLRLKRSALDKLHLPIDVKEGYLGQLTLSIPWSNLKSKSVRVLIENVSLLAVPRDSSSAPDEAEEEERRQVLKQEKLAQDELLSAGLGTKADDEEQKSESFVGSLVTRIVDNVQVTVRDIHIRYEDALSNPAHPFSVGVTLSELSAVSTDGNWKPTFVHNSVDGIHKLARLDSLSAYWNTDDEFLSITGAADLQERLNALIPAQDHIPSHQYILEPVSGIGKLVMRHHATKELPKMSAQLVFDQIGLTLDDQQYADALHMANLFSFYARQVQYRAFRPSEKALEENRPRALLKFALHAIRNEVHQRRRVWTWDYMAERRDLRKEYVRLFKAAQRKAPASNANADPAAPPTDARLQELERQLEYRDIRWFRSLARRELRKERAEAPGDGTPEAQPAPKAESRGWLSWMWGAPAKDDNNVSLSYEQRKELYEAIEWDEATGTSMLFSNKDEAPELVSLSVTAKLHCGFFRLRDCHGGHAILSINFDELQGELQQRPEGFVSTLALGSLGVEDGTTADTQYREIVRLRDRADVDDTQPLFYLQYENKPLDGRADNALEMRLRSLEIVHHNSYVNSIIKFLEPPETELEVIGALLDAANSTLEELRRETRAGLENALENHKTVDIALDVQSPIIVAPEDLSSRDGAVMILDAGHLAVRSLLADPKTMEMIRAKHSKQYTDEDYRQLEELMYDRYFIKLEAAQLVLGDGYDACMESMQVENERERHLLDRINLSFTLQRSILPHAPNLTKLKVAGTLPSLQLHFSDKKYHMLMRLIQQLIHVGAHAADGDAASEPPRQRLERFGTQHNDEAFLEDVNSLSDTSETEAEADDPEDFQDPLVDVPEALRAQHKRFEFQLVVDQVSGTLVKSGTNDVRDMELAEARFSQFRLGVVVYEHKLQVDVRLGALDLIDRMMEHSPQFRHLITSRDKGGEDNAPSDLDLVTVQYTNASPLSPEFHEVHDGIEHTVAVNLSTISLMITRETVLTLYDWILETFVGKDDAATVPDQAEAPAEPSPGEDGPPSKLRVKLKLSSIQLRLNDDGVLLSTLTLSTADVALLKRGETMRVAARLGSLSLDDERERGRVDAGLAKLLSIQGDELVDFAFETFHADEPSYPGYDTSVWLRCNTLQIVYVPEPYADIVAFFQKLATLKAVYDAATDAATAQASQLQSRRGLVKYDVLVKSPIVVLPRTLATRERLTAHLGELYVTNTFRREGELLLSSLEAGLREIYLQSSLLHEDHLDELPMLDHVDVSVTMDDSTAHDVHDMDTPHKTSVSARMSNIAMTLTQEQLQLSMAILRSMSAPPSSPQGDVSLPSPVLAGDHGDEATSDQVSARTATEAARAPSPPAPPKTLHATFELDRVCLDLYDGTATHKDTLHKAQLCQFLLKGTRLKLLQDSASGTDMELALRAFSVTDTRPQRTAHFPELIPPISHDGHQLLLNYSVSREPDAQPLAVVTIDSPKLIFSRDPMFALLEFLKGGLGEDVDDALASGAQTPTVPGSSLASATASLAPRSLAGSPEPEAEAELAEQAEAEAEAEAGSEAAAAAAAPTPNQASLPQGAVTATSDSTSGNAPSALPAPEEPLALPAPPDTPSLHFRVNLVEPRIILLAQPERADSEAIVLMLRQIVVSQQTVLAISITQLGIFVGRMNAPQERQRLLNNVDLSLTLDSRMTPTGKLTSVEVDVERLFVKVTRSDVLLLTAVLQKAMEYGSDSPPRRPSSAPSVEPAPSSDPNGQLLFTRELLALHGSGLQLMLISDLYTLPLLELSLDPFEVSVTDWSSDLRAHTDLGVRLNHFNLATSYWESLLEPWECTLRYEKTLAPPSTSFRLMSSQTLEINVAALMVETSMTSLAQLSAVEVQRDEKRHIAPFRIRNRTGYRISLWSESTGSSTARPTSHRLDDGHDMPWSFSDWRSLRENADETTYNRLAVHIDEMPWERVRHISVDREGEYVMTLRPKLHRVSHRLMCEVKLVDNVKEITFQSTFRLDNRALIPLEVGVLDERGEVCGPVLRIEPGTCSSLPICDAYDKKIRLRPEPGLGYTWSTEAVGWQDLMLQASCAFVCPAQTDGEAPFRFQAYAIRDLQHASSRTYPRLTLVLRAPVEIENVLPYDVHYRLFDKNLKLTWSSALRKGGVSPVHVVALQHLLLLSIDLQDSVYSPSEFAIIASDNPDDFQVEHSLQLADESNLKLELRLYYHHYPDSGGAFKVQIYAPYIFLNLTRLPVTIKARPWAGHSRMVAGQEHDESSPVDALEHAKPFLLSRWREQNNRFVVKVGDSSWSKPLSFDVIGSEVGVAIASAHGDRELQLGLDVQDGLAKFKLSKVVKLTPRYLVRNHLSETISLAEADGGDPITLAPGECAPLLWLLAASDKHAKLRYDGQAQWTAPFSVQNIGTVFLRAANAAQTQHLLQIDVQVNGSTIFIQIRPSQGAWPFMLRNETQHRVLFSQTSAVHESQRSARESDAKRYVLEPRSKMKYAWDEPVATDKYLRLQINGTERVVNIMEIGSLLPFKFPARGDRPAGVVSLDIRADNERQILVISDYTESKSHFKVSRAPVAAQRDSGGFEEVNVDTRIVASYQIELAGAGISLISSNVREIAYITFRGLELSYSESQVTTAVNVICKWIQIDNQTPGSLFPIVLYPTVVPKDGKELDIHPTLQASVIRHKDETHGVHHIKYASVLLQELTAEVDEDFLYAVYDFVRASHHQSMKEYDGSVYIEHPDDVPEPEEQVAGHDQVYIEILHLQPVALNISFMSTNHADVDDTESSRTLFFYIFNVLTMVLGNVNDAPVRLNALVIENVRLSTSVLLQRMAYYYGQDFLFQVHRILGSADFLGNPVGLFNNVSSAVADIFYEPYYGLVMHGNRELGLGLARGASSFVKKTVFGVSDSVSKLTGSISKGFAAVTLDREFQARWKMKHYRNKPKHALYGITVGANALFTSVASGIEGLALRPLEGAEQGGATGFIQGIGRGLVGAVTKPAAGFFDMASSITEGLRNTTLVFEQNQIDRVRLPRFIARDRTIRPYSEREALGQMWLQTVDQGRLLHDDYVAHVNTPGPQGGATIMLSESRICTCWS